MSHDTMSDLLRAVRLRGAVFYYVSLWGEWAADTPPGKDIVEAVFPGSEHLMAFHLVAKGGGWASAGGEPVPLSAGDVLVLPHGDAHFLSSVPDLEPERLGADWVFATRHIPKPIPIAYHYGVVQPGSPTPVEEADTILVCGFLGCDLRPFNPLIGALPRLLHLPAERAGGWLAHVIDQAARESAEPRPGGSAVLERLAEMMFIDTARRYLDSLPENATGWLAGLRDRYVGRALALLHERFMQFLAQPPMHYLANWRIQLGAHLLRETSHTVASIAQEVGYESEAAFSRAFKRLVGMPPARWRRSTMEG